MASNKENVVLLVEDEEKIRNLLSSYMEPMGCRIISVETAEEGLSEVYGEDGEEIDIILLNFKLPKMQGDEFLRILREDRIYTPVLVVTGITRSEGEEVFKDLDIVDVVEKPFNRSDIQSRVRSYLKTSSDINQIGTAAEWINRFIQRAEGSPSGGGRGNASKS